MRYIVIFAVLVLACLGAERRLGKPLTLTRPMSIREVLRNSDTLTGKTVQVKGKVSEVCQMMGCWMALVDPDSGQVLRVKVNDGEISFPNESVGKIAVAEGKLMKIELNKDQALARARHEAEEQGRKFDPATVKSGVTMYQLQGSGAIIQN